LQIALLVYDISSVASFSKAKFWVGELEKHGDPNMIICLVGNKSDLVDERKVSKEEAEGYAREKGFLIFETSARSGDGVQELFVTAGVKAADKSSAVKKQRPTSQRESNAPITLGEERHARERGGSREAGGAKKGCSGSSCV